MFIRIFCLLILSLFLKVYAIEYSGITFTDNVDINKKMEFLDKLYDCTPHKYHASPAGQYQVYGKVKTFCNVRWTVVDCMFPQGVYQDFANVQKIKTLEFVKRLNMGTTEVIRDKNYRYLLDTGNEYCTNRYSDYVR